MHKTISLFALMLFAAALFAQQPEETLFRKSHIRGGFASPMFAWSPVNHKTGYGAGGGAGMVFDHFFIGLFGMGEVYDAPQVGQNQLAMGYGGLWLGYTFPSYKLVHLYTSLKIAEGSAGTANFDDDWNFDDQVRDATFVVVPEAGLELNIARWMRLSGTVGYRFVNGFEGWGTYGKNDLNAPVFGLTMRLGWFGGKWKETAATTERQ